MQPRIDTYRALDGYRLHYRHWEPAKAPPTARIVAVHGIQSHSGWYAWSTSQLCQAGCEVFFLDRRGSGMNETGRGDAPSVDSLVNDVLLFLSDLKLESRITGMNVPTVLMAVSWGGKLATIATARRPDLVDGLALLYPGLKALVRATWWQQIQLALADRLGIRRKRVPIPLEDPALFTGGSRWQDFIRNDPLALRDVTVSFLLANRDLDRFLDACPPAIHQPVLLMLAGKDDIIDNEATRRYVEGFASTERMIHEYPEARHTLEFEPDRQRFVDDLVAWIRQLAATRANQE
jgi:alpha-beta hydrolase superfamily lysophospholipase